MGSEREPYVSCIVIKGRPILPPVMTPFRYAEMRRYKELALALEKKYGRRKRTSASASCETQKKDFNCLLGPTAVVRNMSQKVNRLQIRDPLSSQKEDPLLTIEDPRPCTSPMINSTCASISTPPSVASTYLDKYMSVRQDSGHRDLIPELDADSQVISSRSSTATLTPDGPFESGTSEERYPDGDSRVPTRRRSYTLEQPSPVLIAHFQRMVVEDGTRQLQTVIPENHPRSDQDEAVVEGPSPGKGPSVREQHLHRYLRQVASLSLSGTNGLDTPNFVDKLFHEQELLVGKVDDGPIPETNKPSSDGFGKSEHNAEDGADEDGASPPSDCIRTQMPPNQIEKERADGNLKFCRLSAAVKGYLTRRLLRTERVQTIIQTIKDTLEFALQLHSESPLKRGCISGQDARLHQRLIAQLSGACFEFHDVFFKIGTNERMKIIAQDRALKQQKNANRSLVSKPAEHKRPNRHLSSATLKTIARKRHHGRMSLSPYSGRSPRRRTRGRSCRRMLGNALDAVRPYSASPTFGPLHETDAFSDPEARC